MELRIFTEPQNGMTFDDQLALAKESEALGFAGYFRSDHYLAMTADAGPGPTDSWVTLGALARETSTIRLGTLVTSATFRMPGPLAISVAQVDVMSGGRVDFGLGTGWFAPEYDAIGMPFPSFSERFERLEEQLEIITGLWKTAEGDRFSFDGRHYKMDGNPGLPRPVQEGGPPIIIGGLGNKRTPALAARFADEFNTPFAPPETARDLHAGVDAACEAAGRDPSTIVRSSAITVCVGKDTAEVARRAAAIGADPDELRGSGLCGTPDQVVERIGEYTDAGSARLYLQVNDVQDLDHLRLIAAEVLPRV